MTAVAAVMALQRPAVAGPTGGTVVAGSASISQSGPVTNINQSTAKAIIDWLGFSIGRNETVNFFQPSSSSITLNRVIGNEASVISGALNANGQVFIINSAGVLFTRNAQVNAGGLVASTLDISNQSFMAGNYTFSGTSSAPVVNQGHIHISPGGYVALLGNTVSNEGVINATLGTVAMAAGDKITLNFGGNSLVDVTVDQGTLNALVQNKRAIIANGGQVILTAKAADQLLSAQVNNTGVIQAHTMAALKGGGNGTVHIGKIKLLADGGTVNVGGKLDASAPKGGNGGTIETSGNTVHVASGAVITTKAANGQNGTWTLDPYDIIISSSPDSNTSNSSGTFTGSADPSNINVNTLEAALANGNVTISTTGAGSDAGNITVASSLIWLANTVLTLNATNNININAPISATGASAGLVLNYGNFASTGTVVTGTNYSFNNGASITLNGASASLSINGKNYVLIDTMSALHGISGTLNYALGQNLNASGSGTFAGPVVATLSGTLAGLGNTISNLSISAPTTTGVGLTGSLSGTVRDLTLQNVSVTGGIATGALAGQTQATSTIANVSVIGTTSSTASGGTVTGSSDVGGLVGLGRGVITNSTTNVAVVGSGSSLGGLVGFNFSTGAIVTNSSATGNVSTSGTSAVSAIGGLAGTNSGLITGSSATEGIVSANNATDVGGLVGNNNSSATALATINGGSFSSDQVRVTCSGSASCGGSSGLTGTGIGGLVGFNNGGIIGDASPTSLIVKASGTVVITTTSDASVQGVGGLVGTNTNNGSRRGTIQNASATGGVDIVGLPNGTGSVNSVGGVVGINLGTVTNVTSAGTVTGDVEVGGIVGDNLATVSNATSFANVIGQGAVGGIAGANGAGNLVAPATISNSSSFGNVTGKNLGFPGGNIGDNVGGVAGVNEGSLVNDTAHGVITGVTDVGGIVGFNLAPQINELGGTGSGDSFSGTVNGQTNTGVGLQFGTNQNPSGFSNSTGTGTLSTPATRAADLAAAQTGNTIATTETETSAANPPDGNALPAAGTGATNAAAAPKIDDNIADEQLPRRRVAAASHKPSHGKGAGFGASIRSIDINGQRFNLQGGGQKGN